MLILKNSITGTCSIVFILQVNMVNNLCGLIGVGVWWEIGYMCHTWSNRSRSVVGDRLYVPYSVIHGVIGVGVWWEIGYMCHIVSYME